MQCFANDKRPPKTRKRIVLQLRLRCRRGSLDLGVHLVDEAAILLCRLRTLELEPVVLR